jgi:uncharacterized glyoxalase superfamily protein PhnB
MNIKSLTPNLLVDSVQESIEFYIDVLEFAYVMGVDDKKQLYLQYDKDQALGFAILQKNSTQLMFQSLSNANADLNSSLKRDKSITNIALYFEIEGFDEFYEKIKNQVTIVNEPRHTFYGMKEFFIQDNSGNLIAFAEKLV